MSLQQYSQEELREMSFVELASLILSEKREALSFQQLVDEVAALIGLSEQEVKQRLAQYYTDLNIDGRFICVGENVWGLRTWYPFDQTEDETVMVTKPKKKKVLDDEYDDYDDLLDEEDIDYDDLDEYDEDDLDLDEDELLEDDEFDLDDDVEFDDEILDNDEFGLGDDELDEELEIDDPKEDG
ncbi:DNA-directed RNA polymerase subunit delta [Saccharococcus caldoxylosilyticus]|uniref:Probable DNA-directed RNA polymerase subunit delta n=1 Tax=Parageobacillus caldoxylosilyticus NBRC 107762 TaxID=1220594 RepID=A0A023DAS1_9BACL|nr:DNA-directed RNA polymerase subunit delta [Parageobacillus caldoxylosilyticus]MBB3851156.1 DNA-directed RNA polymerase subunit delta [Parageobacillus caldoxylosilyticus]GAJ38435.1 putative DNA-directed RNA polymerase subunit delta [Parageobacillus caldoxylosilyticus NBRC 107762]